MGQPGKAPRGAVNGAVGGAQPKGQPFWANLGASLNRQSRNLGDGINKAWTDMGKNSKGWKPPKFEMPVHVDVDFLGPFVLSVKKSAHDFYVRLPPPLQQGLPYFAVGAGTTAVVWKIQGMRLRGQWTVNEKLQARVDKLLEDREKLQDQVKNLRSKTSGPRSASEMQMAAAVAEATSAAAAAASAAAAAAGGCAVVVRKPPGDKRPERRAGLGQEL